MCILAAVAAASVTSLAEALPSHGSPAAPQRRLRSDPGFEDFSKGFPKDFDVGLPTYEFDGNLAESRTISRRMGVTDAIATILAEPYQGPVPSTLKTLFHRNELQRPARQSLSSVNYSPIGPHRLAPSGDDLSAEPRRPSPPHVSPASPTYPQHPQSNFPSSSNPYPTFSHSPNPQQGFIALRPSQRIVADPPAFSSYSSPDAFFESARIRGKRDVSPREGVTSHLESMLASPYQGSVPQSITSLFDQNNRKARNPEALPPHEAKNGISDPRSPPPPASTPFQLPFDLPNFFAKEGQSSRVPTMTEARQTLVSTIDNLLKTPYQTIIPETINNLFNKNNPFASKAQNKDYPAPEPVLRHSSLPIRPRVTPGPQDKGVTDPAEPKGYFSGGTEHPILAPQLVPISPFSVQLHPLGDIGVPEYGGRGKRDLSGANRQSLDRPSGVEEETSDFGNIQEGFWQRLDLDSFFGEPSSIFSRKDPVFSGDAAASVTEERPDNREPAEAVRPVYRPKKIQVTSAKENKLIQLPIIHLPDFTSLRQIPSLLAKPFRTGPSFRSLSSATSSERIPRHIQQNRRLPKVNRQQDIVIQRRSFVPQEIAQQRQFDHAFFQEPGANDPESKGFIVGQPESFPSFSSIGGFGPMQDQPETANFVEEFVIPSVPIPDLPDTPQQQFTPPKFPPQVRSSRVHRTSEELPAGAVPEVSQPSHHRVPRQLDSFAVFNFPRFTTGGEVTARPLEDGRSSSLSDALSARFGSRSISRVITPRGLTSDDIVVPQSQRYFPSLGSRRPVSLPSPPHRFFPSAPIPPNPPSPRDLLRFKTHAPGFRDFHETFYGTRNHESVRGRPEGGLLHPIPPPPHTPRDFPPVENSLLGSGNFEVLSGGTFYDEDDLHQNHHFDHFLDNSYVVFPNADVPYTNNHVDDFFSNFRDFSEFAVRRSGTSNTPEEEPTIIVDGFASEVVEKRVKPEGGSLLKSEGKEDKGEGKKKKVDFISNNNKTSNVVNKDSNVDLATDSEPREDPTSPSPVTETQSQDVQVEEDLVTSSSSIISHAHGRPKNIQEVLEEIEEDSSAPQDSPLNAEEEEEIDPLMATF
ncbi:uncharacterized protein LOC143034005 [Oratosquilla oratoria]|uniref:uncharacterized protein LOC143034005 n=1 Tax=Oratosquilla oratoria TaxID=337810 RepID=UPI003F75A954